MGVPGAPVGIPDIGRRLPYASQPRRIRTVVRLPLLTVLSTDDGHRVTQVKCNPNSVLELVSTITTDCRLESNRKRSSGL